MVLENVLVKSTVCPKSGKIHDIFFDASMLFPHYDLLLMNTPKSEEQLPNSENGTNRGARGCNIKSDTHIRP